jgi:hypothetical protein
MTSQEEQSTPQQRVGGQPDGAREGRPVGAGLDLDQAIQQQVAQAVQPVLTEFQRQIVQTVRQELEQTLHPAPGAGRRPSGEQPAQQPREERPQRAVAEPVQTTTPVEPPEKQRLLPGPSALLDTLSDVLEEQAEQTIQALLAAGLDVLFSDSVYRTVQAQGEQAVQSVVQLCAEAIPDQPEQRRLCEHVEQTLRGVLLDSLDTIFSGSVRSNLQSHGERAVQAIARGDFEAAEREGKEGFESLIDGVLAVLQRYQEEVLRLVRRVILKAIQEVLGSTIKDSLRGILPIPSTDVEESTKKVSENLKEKGEELQEDLQGAVEELQYRVEQETGQLQQRVAEGLQSALKGGTQRQLGQLPSGRPPSGRPPSGQPPSGQPPSGQPPSAQRSSSRPKRGSRSS